MQSLLIFLVLYLIYNEEYRMIGQAIFKCFNFPSQSIK